MKEQDLAKYEKKYSEKGLLDKIGKFAKKAGMKFIYYVLLLWYVLQKPSLPAKIKVTILGSLGYFIFPFDLIPDFTPFIGLVDDFGAIALAVGIALVYIDDEVKEKARKKLSDWFGKIDESELDKYENEINKEKN